MFGPTSCRRCVSTLLKAMRRYAKKLRICRLTPLLSRVLSAFMIALSRNFVVILRSMVRAQLVMDLRSIPGDLLWFECHSRQNDSLFAHLALPSLPRFRPKWRTPARKKFQSMWNFQVYSLQTYRSMYTRSNWLKWFECSRSWNAFDETGVFFSSVARMLIKHFWHRTYGLTVTMIIIAAAAVDVKKQRRNKIRKTFWQQFRLALIR